MVGNVWEWVDGAVNGGIFENRQLPGDGFVDGIDESDALPSKTSPDSQDLYNGDRFWIKTEGTRTIARGGYWNNNSDAGEYSHYIVSLPTDATNAIGFRCVKNAGAD